MSRKYLSVKETLEIQVIPDHATRSANKPTLKALSFFSGCMGLDLGLEQEGIEVLLACEVDTASTLFCDRSSLQSRRKHDYI